MKTEIAQMKPYLFDQPGHSGRIFCAKYFPNDTTTIYSGGWDRTIQFYDTRTCKVSNSIYGPEICGDSLDLSGSILASGAWSTKEQIQLLMGRIDEGSQLWLDGDIKQRDRFVFEE